MTKHCNTNRICQATRSPWSRCPRMGGGSSRHTSQKSPPLQSVIPSRICVRSRTNILNCGQSPVVPRALSLFDRVKEVRERRRSSCNISHRLETRRPQPGMENGLMKTRHGTRFANWQGWKFCATSLLSFAGGAPIGAHWIHVQEVRAESNRVFGCITQRLARFRSSNLYFGTSPNFRPTRS